MERIRTYRARSMQDAIELVRQDLGPDASVLHAREIKSGVMSWVGRGRQIEVTASAAISAPRRFTNRSPSTSPANGAALDGSSSGLTSGGEPEPQSDPQHAAADGSATELSLTDPALTDPALTDWSQGVFDSPDSNTDSQNSTGAWRSEPEAGAAYYRERDREQLAIPSVLCQQAPLDHPQGAESLERAPLGDESVIDRGEGPVEAPASAVMPHSGRVSFGTRTIGLRQHAAERERSGVTGGRGDNTSDLEEDASAKFRDAIRNSLVHANLSAEVAGELVSRLDSGWTCEEGAIASALQRVSDFVERDLRVSGALGVSGERPRVVALVGPTGVGKTTTIAKLAANFQLREQRSVGLITVDTYRIAAVDQLQTYADIIDVPLRVVASLREVQGAIDAMSDKELILLDTAGRSPKDSVKIRELGALLAEAQADEVHLVLSSTADERHLTDAASCFQSAGVSSLILTKLDEVDGLGGVLSMLRESKLPLSYVTDGQDVPEDIRVASSRRVADAIVGLKPAA